MSVDALNVQDLKLSFGALKASNGISLDLKCGEIHALIGPNGAGKTTLINQIYGLLRPDFGNILLRGEDITTSSIASRVHKGLSRSFQMSNVLMDFTVLENAIIAQLAKLKAAYRFFRPAFSDPQLITKAEFILSHVGLLDKKDQLVSTIAHGERRLLEIGLAMANSPAVLLLDEPMAGTGPSESQFITELIAALKTKTSILLIEHDMDAVFFLADRITVLVEGRSIACGTVEEISNDEAIRAAYLGNEVC